MRRAWDVARRLWAPVLLALVVAALVVRHSVRDSVPAVGPLFYGTPPAVLLVAAAVAWLAALLRRRRVLATAGAAVFAACAADLVASSWVTRDEAVPGEVRGLVWNVARGLGGWHPVAQAIRREDPDVAWLVECGPSASGADDALREAMPLHHVVRVGGGMIVVTRGQVGTVRRSRLSGAGRAAVERIHVRGRTVVAIHVDLASSPTRSRGPAFVSLDRLIARHAAEPLLVVGDFNTPRDSVHFDAWRGPLAHAFETAGTGYVPTWPVPVPVLALDHVWTSPQVRVRTCRQLWEACSDHRPVLFTFD